MNGLMHMWEQGDAVGKAVAAMLLIMSISAWVVIFWKGWLLSRARRDLVKGAQLFWDSTDLAAGRAALQGMDREAVLLPLVESISTPAGSGTLAARSDREAQLTRRLRDSLHAQQQYARAARLDPLTGLYNRRWLDEVANVRIHDLRHTHASIGIAAGGSLAVIGKQLGHSSPTTTSTGCASSARPRARARCPIRTSSRSTTSASTASIRTSRWNWSTA